MTSPAAAVNTTTTPPVTTQNTNPNTSSLGRTWQWFKDTIPFAITTLVLTKVFRVLAQTYPYVMIPVLRACWVGVVGLALGVLFQKVIYGPLNWNEVGAAILIATLGTGVVVFGPPV